MIRKARSNEKRSCGIPHPASWIASEYFTVDRRRSVMLLFTLLEKFAAPAALVTLFPGVGGIMSLLIIKSFVLQRSQDDGKGYRPSAAAAEDQTAFDPHRSERNNQFLAEPESDTGKRHEYIKTGYERRRFQSHAHRRKDERTGVPGGAREGRREAEAGIQAQARPGHCRFCCAGRQTASHRRCVHASQ